MFQATDTLEITPNTDTTAPVEAFTIDSLDRLTWYLRKVGNLQAERARIKAQADMMLKQIETELQSLTGHFDAQAEQFTREELARRGGKRKSLTTLQGTCSLRTVPARLSVTDTDAALKAARSWQAVATVQGYDLLPQTLNRADFAAFAKAELERTGELLPGVEVVDARESFSVSFKSGDEGKGEK